MPTLPLTTFGDRLAAVDLDNKSFSLTFAQPIAIQDLLLLIVRGTELSIVPDQGVGGSFIGELKRVTVRQALGLILPPLGLDYAATGGFIHVFRRKPEMRLFDVNVASAQRTATSTTGSGSRPGSTAQVSTMTTIDPYADLAKGLQMLLSEQGTFTLDRTAGLLHVIDFPDRLDRVEAYLDALHDRVHRQVQIDVQVIEVTLTAPRTRLDWAALSQASMEEGAPAAAPRPRTGLRVADLDRLLTALAQQGTVSTMAHPRVLALNNEPAIVHAAGRARDEITLVVTPQIGSTGVITLSVSPLVSRRPASGDEDVRADVDTLARVADGETVVLASLAIADQVEPPSPGRRARSVPTSVPTRTKTHGERLVLLTPKVLASRAD
jgi:type II secretory pathway component HofQ